MSPRIETTFVTAAPFVSGKLKRLGTGQHIYVCVIGIEVSQAIDAWLWPGERVLMLHVALMGLHLISASKKGMSALQFQRMLGLTYCNSLRLPRQIGFALLPSASMPPW